MAIIKNPTAVMTCLTCQSPEVETNETPLTAVLEAEKGNWLNYHLLPVVDIFQAMVWSPMDVGNVSLTSICVLFFDIHDRMLGNKVIYTWT